MNTFGEILKEARLAKRYTRREVSELLNKSESCIADIENNRRRPFPLEDVKKLEIFFEVPQGYLCEIAEYYRDIAPFEITKKIRKAPQLGALIRLAEKAAADGKSYDEISKAFEKALNKKG